MLNKKYQSNFTVHLKKLVSELFFSIDLYLKNI